jgi:hypothetical protein
VRFGRLSRNITRFKDSSKEDRMKLEELLKGLDNIKAGNDNENWESELVTIAILELLVRYIGNSKVEEKINEIAF